MPNQNINTFASIPMTTVGPIKINGPIVDEEILVPLATFESPVWATTNRGAKVTKLAGGIHAIIVDDRMTRSILVEAESAHTAWSIQKKLQNRMNDIKQITEKTSRFAQFENIHFQLTGNLLFIRLEMKTGDASGHNMVTKAADALMNWLLAEYPELKYISVSGNYCVDKKVSAVNGILGRGKNVIADLIIPSQLCSRHLKTTPEKIAEINIKKNLYGSIIGGGIRSANAHFANMLLAFYLATGQDAANIIEGSQGFVTAEVRQENLYFAVTLPNLIVGTVGSGKNLEFVENNLTNMGCKVERQPGDNTRRLALIAAATVLCGELSLLAALTNRGELMRAHETLERK